MFRLHNVHVYVNVLVLKYNMRHCLHRDICRGFYQIPLNMHIQWNRGIRDTQGTVKKCPEFRGGLISQVHSYVMNRPRDWSSCPYFPGCPYFSGGLKNRFHCIHVLFFRMCRYARTFFIRICRDDPVNRKWQSYNPGHRYCHGDTSLKWNIASRIDGYIYIINSYILHFVWLDGRQALWVYMDIKKDTYTS